MLCIRVRARVRVRVRVRVLCFVRPVRFDSHNPLSTIFEAVHFSGRLRLPKTVSEAELDKKVWSVLKLLEIDHLAQAIIGAPSTGGVAPEVTTHTHRQASRQTDEKSVVLCRLADLAFFDPHPVTVTATVLLTYCVGTVVVWFRFARR